MTEPGPTPTGDEGVSLLYQDPHLVVANKPSGMLVHRGPDKDRVVVMTVVRDMVGHYVYPVHRLDRGTSGALVMALSPEIARAIQEALQAHRVDKRYVALVRGITPDQGFIDHAIQRRQGGPRVPSQTAFRRLHAIEDPGRYSLVEAAPITGRRHQIRRHLKHISHPLIGDVRYGKGEHNRFFRRHYDLHRLALHAHRITFDHPVTGDSLRVSAPLPPELHSTFVRLGAPEGLLLDTPWDPRATPTADAGP